MSKPIHSELLLYKNQSEKNSGILLLKFLFVIILEPVVSFKAFCFKTKSPVSLVQ
jgi:hypothetical protein